MKNLYQKTFDQICMSEKQTWSMREKLAAHCEDSAGRRATRAFVYKRITQSVAGVVALAVCFVLAVNLSTPIALACGKVPILRELAQAVITTPSLAAAVANEHVQLIQQERTVNGYTVCLEYVIADQKQVNAFVTVDGEAPGGGRYHVYADVAGANVPPHNILGCLANPGEMDYITINFTEEQTPEHLDLSIIVYELSGNEELARCEFSLDMESDQLKQGRIVKVSQDFVLDGNIMTISTVELYPTHIRLNVEEDADNADYLVDLSLAIDGDDKTVKRTDSKGLHGYGGGEFGTYSVYSASSSYYGSEELTVTIHGATWLNKERQETVLDLVTGTATGLPDGVEFRGVVDYDGKKALQFYSTATSDRASDPFNPVYRDESGTIGEFTGGSYTYGTGEVLCYLDENPGEKLILDNIFSSVMRCEEPLVLTVDVAE